MADSTGSEWTDPDGDDAPTGVARLEEDGAVWLDGRRVARRFRWTGVPEPPWTRGTGFSLAGELEADALVAFRARGERDSVRLPREWLARVRVAGEHWRAHRKSWWALAAQRINSRGDIQVWVQPPGSGAPEKSRPDLPGGPELETARARPEILGGDVAITADLTRARERARAHAALLANTAARPPVAPDDTVVVGAVYHLGGDVRLAAQRHFGVLSVGPRELQFSFGELGFFEQINALIRSS